MATEVLMKRVPGGLAISVMVMGTILAAPIGVVGAAVVHAVGDRAAADAGRGLRQGACHRHHRLGRYARHPDPAGDHDGRHGRDAEYLVGRPVRRGHHAGLPAVGPLPALHPLRLRSFKPTKAPKMPADYGPQTGAEFWRVMWTGLFPMTMLMVIVLGAIFAGWATATESAGVGVSGRDAHRVAQQPAVMADAERGHPVGLPRERAWCS